MAEKNSFQFGLFGYSKKDVELKFDSLKEQYESERNALLSQKTELERDVDNLRKKEAEFNEKNSRYEEVEQSVSSILSVTQKASERVFEEANSQKLEVAAIVSDAADQIAVLRKEIIAVRDNMNAAIDDLQERLDIVDKTLVNSVSRLVSVKQDVLNRSTSPSDIQAEVERLLEIAGKDIDINPGVRSRVPSVGNVGSSMITQSAARVMSSRNNAYYGLASDRTDGGIAKLVEQVDFQLAEATADDGLIEKTDGFLNSPANAGTENSQGAENSGEADKAEDKKDYGLSDIEPTEDVPASTLFADPDWFTASPLISNDKKPAALAAKKKIAVKTNKISVKKASAPEKIKVKPRKV